MRKIILSYDYELFFGEKSGTVLKTLIEPTNLLLHNMEEYGFRGNFFVDWQMLKYLKAAKTKRTDEDLELITNQLKDIVKRGHRIELHIHPHWVDAIYNGDGTWDFSKYEHYSLNSLPDFEVTEMFKEGVNLLNGIARTVDPSYSICAFRAGGWAVQPFSKLTQGFLDTGIKIDSSVAYKAYGKNQYSYYDFTKAPNISSWPFDSDVCLPAVKGQFIEVPITSYHRGLIDKVVDGIFRRCSNKLNPISDGTHYRNDLKEESHPRDSKSVGMMTLSRISPITILWNFLKSKNDLVVFIDHPKDYSISASQAMRLLSKHAITIMYKDFLNYEE